MRDTKFRTRLFLCFLAVIVMTLVIFTKKLSENSNSGFIIFI